MRERKIRKKEVSHFSFKDELDGPNQDRNYKGERGQRTAQCLEPRQVDLPVVACRADRPWERHPQLRRRRTSKSPDS